VGEVGCGGARPKKGEAGRARAILGLGFGLLTCSRFHGETRGLARDRCSPDG
jgi:hypothetical protein